MRRLNIFAKGNVDLHDSLVYSRVNSQIEWNGINTVLAERFPLHVARVRHEPCARWDLCGIEGNEVPRELIERGLDLGSFNTDVQYRSKMLGRAADAVILSIQSDVMNRLSRHIRGGYSFFPAASDSWSAEDRHWLAREFTTLDLCTPAASMERMRELLEAIRRTANPTILVFNMSSAIPGEQIVSHRGFDDGLSTRIRAFNVALAMAASRLDFSVVDVDHVIARAGVDRLKLDVLHCTNEGYRLIAEEVVRLLESLGHLDL